MLDRIRAPLGGLVAQLFFIAAGVYLGNQADDWKEDRAHRAAARAALVSFRTELRANQAAVARKLPYHRALRDSLAGIVARPLRTPGEFWTRTRWAGVQTVRFRRTAYDLALSTGALSHVEPRVAFAVASVYDGQAALESITAPFLAATFTPQTFALAARDAMPLVRALSAQMEDVAVYGEPELLRLYERVRPRLDAAIARLPE